MSEDQVKNHNRSGFLNWAVLRDLLAVLLMGIVGWKLLNSDLKIDLSAFSFSDLLALLLALFSVALSVAFYFNATHTSNRFYDNSYKFTKEMSEILGRIEAGFGERLRHLDEGYSGIRDKFDRLPPYGPATADDVRKEEEEVKKREQEQHELLENLARRAKLAEGEKRTVFAQLAKKSEELDQARMELRQLQNSHNASRGDPSRSHDLVRYLASKIKEATHADPDPRSLDSSPNRIFQKIKDELPKIAIRDLDRYDFLDEEGDLTRDAIMRIRLEMKRI